MSPVKVLDHRACFVPHPMGMDEPWQMPHGMDLASELRRHSEHLGDEVIDLWWLRGLLKAAADKIGDVAVVYDVRDICQRCGYTRCHHPTCSVLQR